MGVDCLWRSQAASDVSALKRNSVRAIQDVTTRAMEGSTIDSGSFTLSFNYEVRYRARSGCCDVCVAAHHDCLGRCCRARAISTPVPQHGRS